MCQVVRVQDLFETIEDLFDQEDPATSHRRINGTCDEVLFADDWMEDIETVPK